MGFVGDLLGVGGNTGSSFRAESIPVLQGTDLNQVGNAYDQTQTGLQRQMDFMNALQRQGGLQNQSNVFGQQQGLADQLQNLANGQGPNPALAQLANTTGQNVAAQGALMAGQRGSGSNAGLLARQIGMQGANIGQQATGQAALLGAQQQLGALGALQNQQSNMANLANSQVNQQANSVMGYNQAAQSQQQNLLNALGQYNSTRVGQQNAINSANAGIANTTAQGQQGLLGGVLGGIGAAFMESGGMVQGYADGGMADPNGPASFAANFLKGFTHPSNFRMVNPQQESGANQLQGGTKGLTGGLMGIAMNSGAMVPGKAQVGGDSLQNDKVPAMLSPKEIVIPRSITLSENAPEKAKQFVAAILAKQGMLRKKA